ncbi:MULTISPECIES: hypothetical protein [unclassified Leucobacter]|uniref:hypothetical protein n=1 Tax=unclassified Leucobacter TaxID=2621730 RepID=UPI00165D9708|nr:MULTISPECIES: hypothetical protein [unclassified Leucobacter]MBC9935193.1 hypothetical protein [Leucobacter sp. cx-87]
MTHSPGPPPIHLLPPAVRSAERLRGTLVPCGPGLRPVAWPEAPRVRAATLEQLCSPSLAAVLATAAWVWGARRALDRPVEVAGGRGGAAAERFDPGLRVRDLRFDAGELHQFGGLRVSTPARTVSDLLRLREDFGAPDRAACRLLLRLVPGGAAEVAASLARHPVPHRRRALERLGDV